MPRTAERMVHCFERPLKSQRHFFATSIISIHNQLSTVMLTVEDWRFQVRADFLNENGEKYAAKSEELSYLDIR